VIAHRPINKSNNKLNNQMHIPVLLQEVLDGLAPRPGEFFIDGTLGAGGHTRAIIERITPGGTLLAVDRDPRAVRAFTQTNEAPNTVKVIVEASSYSQLPQLLTKHGLPQADGLLLDLGFSSEQVSGGALAGRGFSFGADEPLLMTYDDETPSVAQLLAELTASDLAAIIREYGEERYADKIAASIITQAREKGIATTGQLVEAIVAAVGTGYEHGRLHPATRTFQALRIYANGELRQLELLLEQLPALVRPGGRVAIISFHSLEDRIVKQYFKAFNLNRVRGGSSVGGRQKGAASAGELPNSTPASAGTKKPITASEDEMARNPRARSAKLRVLQL
jgi:16S rRNA (cytosine1402-N4)-methyltransferase